MYDRGGSSPRERRRSTRRRGPSSSSKSRCRSSKRSVEADALTPHPLDDCLDPSEFDAAIRGDAGALGTLEDAECDAVERFRTTSSTTTGGAEPFSTRRFAPPIASDALSSAHRPNVIGTTARRRSRSLPPRLQTAAHTMRRTRLSWYFLRIIKWCKQPNPRHVIATSYCVHGRIAVAALPDNSASFVRYPAAHMCPSSWALCQRLLTKLVGRVAVTESRLESSLTGWQSSWRPGNGRLYFLYSMYTVFHRPDLVTNRLVRQPVDTTSVNLLAGRVVQDAGATD